MAPVLSLDPCVTPYTASFVGTCALSPSLGCVPHLMALPLFSHRRGAGVLSVLRWTLSLPFKLVLDGRGSSTQVLGPWLLLLWAPHSGLVWAPQCCLWRFFPMSSGVSVQEKGRQLHALHLQIRCPACSMGSGPQGPSGRHTGGQNFPLLGLSFSAWMFHECVFVLEVW